MEISQLFLQRYDPLTNFYYAGLWQAIPHELMRRRPHPRVNSIAWILWHVARAEDVGVNCFVAGRPQLLVTGGWAERMNAPWRSHGSEMSLEEVDELSRRIDLAALQAYCEAVQACTREIAGDLSAIDLNETLEEDFLRRLMFDEEVAHLNPEGFVANYLGWSKGKCLFNMGLTHPYQHLGEIETLATLLGIQFE